MEFRSSRYFGLGAAFSVVAGGLLLSACASTGPTDNMAMAPAGPALIPPKIRDLMPVERSDSRAE